MIVLFVLPKPAASSWCVLSSFFLFSSVPTLPTSEKEFPAVVDLFLLLLYFFLVYFEYLLWGEYTFKILGISGDFSLWYCIIFFLSLWRCPSIDTDEHISSDKIGMDCFVAFQSLPINVSHIQGKFLTCKSSWVLLFKSTWQSLLVAVFRLLKQCHSWFTWMNFDLLIWFFLFCLIVFNWLFSGLSLTSLRLEDVSGFITCVFNWSNQSLFPNNIVYFCVWTLK